MEGFYYKPRADIELLKEYAEGIICTTACLKGEVGHNFFVGQDARALEAIDKLHGVFGDDFYLELQENGLEEQGPVNKKIITYARAHGLNLVATNDCHYMTQEDAMAQEVLLCIQTGKTYSDENRMRMASQEFYFKTPEQMREAFAYCPEACDNTLRIADKCQLELKWVDDEGNQIYHLPDFPIETGESTEDYFERMAVEGLEERFEGAHFKNLRKEKSWESEVKPQYTQRLSYEVDMIKKWGLRVIFLWSLTLLSGPKRRGSPWGQDEVQGPAL